MQERERAMLLVLVANQLISSGPLGNNFNPLESICDFFFERINNSGYWISLVHILKNNDLSLIVLWEQAENLIIISLLYQFLFNPNHDLYLDLQYTAIKMDERLTVGLRC